MLPNDWLKQLKLVYPKRGAGQGWGKVKKLVHILIEDGESWEDILAGAKRYGDYCRATNEQYVRMAQTFYGPDEWWQEDYELPGSNSKGMPKEITDQERAEDKRKADKELANYLKVVK